MCLICFQLHRYVISCTFLALSQLTISKCMKAKCNFFLVVWWRQPMHSHSFVQLLLQKSHTSTHITYLQAHLKVARYSHRHFCLLYQAAGLRDCRLLVECVVRESSWRAEWSHAHAVTGDVRSQAVTERKTSFPRINKSTWKNLSRNTRARP